MPPPPDPLWHHFKQSSKEDQDSDDKSFNLKDAFENVLFNPFLGRPNSGPGGFSFDEMDKE